MRFLAQKGWILLLGGLGILVSACSRGGYVKKGEIPQTLEQEAFQKKYVEAIGIGAADPTIANTTQRKALSRDAAIVKAQYELLSMIQGLQLTGGITVQKAIETDSDLRTHMDAEIKAAEVVRTEWTNDDGCVVTLRLYKGRLDKILGGKLLEK